MTAGWPFALALLLSPAGGATSPYPQSVPVPRGSPPPAYQLFEIEARDGTRLAVHEWAPPRPTPGKPVVLMIHGIGFHGAPFASVAPGFTARGLTLVAPDLRGHGRSGGERGELAEPHVLRADTGAVIDLIARLHSRSPVVLAGDSMGGLLAADYAWRGEKRLAGLALLVPAFGVHPSRALEPRGSLDLGNLLAGRVSLDNPNNLAAATHDPGFVKAKQADPLPLHSVSLSYITRLGTLQAECLRGAPEIKVPLFVAVGGNDKVINNQVVESFYRAAGTPARAKTWRKWDGACHTLCWDPATPEVIRELTTWALGRGQ